MQWHWGNIGSAAAGLAALLATVLTIYGVVKYGPAWLRDSRARQQAQAAAAREQAILARQQGEQISLERRRGLYGWSRHGIDTFRVALVTSAEEMAEAREELTGGGPTGYVILRVAESEEKSGNANRGLRLRQIMLRRPWSCTVRACSSSCSALAWCSLALLIMASACRGVRC